MKIYNVKVPLYANISLEIVAKNKQEAVKMALESAGRVIDNLCGSGIEDMELGNPAGFVNVIKEWQPPDPEDNV